MANFISKDQIDTWAQKYSVNVPSVFFVRMADRESGFDADSVLHEGNGTVSIGLLQIDAEEAASVGMDGADLTDPETNVKCGCLLMDKRLRALASRYGFDVSTPPTDAWYFLAFAHNAGLGRAEQFIDGVGSLDWDAAKTAHPDFNEGKTYNYAEDIGGAAIAATRDSGSAGPFVDNPPPAPGADGTGGLIGFALIAMLLVVGRL